MMMITRSQAKSVATPHRFEIPFDFILLAKGCPYFSSVLVRAVSLGDVTSSFYRIPPEVWMMIGEDIGPRDLARLLQVCAFVHDVISFLLYRKVILVGRQGRRCGAMLASEKGNSRFYASLVQEVAVFSFEIADQYLSMTVFARALKHMNALRALHMHISPHNSASFIHCVVREQNGDNDHVWYPNLARVLVNGTPSLLEVMGFQHLTELSLNQPLSMSDLVDTMDKVDKTNTTVLRLQLRKDTCPRDVFSCIAKHCSVLTSLSLEQPDMDARVSRVGSFSAIEANACSFCLEFPTSASFISSPPSSTSNFGPEYLIGLEVRGKAPWNSHLLR
jgi:hypothetical protein